MTTKIVNNGTTLTGIKSCVYQVSLNSGTDLRPGCVASSSIEVEVFGSQSDAPAAGDALSYYQVDQNGTETLIGVFYAEPVIATKNTYKFVAYDAASKLDADFSEWLQANQASFPMTVYSLVSAACTVAGVTLGSASWPLSTQSVNAFYSSSVTCRQIVSWAAEIACKYVYCDTAGALTFGWYSTVSNKRIYKTSEVSGAETRYAYKQDGLQYANYTVATLDRVAVYPSGTDDAAYIYPTGISSGNTLSIKNNLLLTGAAAATYSTVAQTIYTGVSGVGAYRPATIQMFPNECPFAPGDIVDVTDIQNVSFVTAIMNANWSESGVVLESTGEEVYAEDQTSLRSEIVQLASDIVRIDKLKVSWAEIEQAVIDTLESEDITTKNLTVIDSNDNVIATFRGSTVTLGKTTNTHAELDYHSLQLIDNGGNAYFFAGDLRDANEEYSTSAEFVGTGYQTSFRLYLKVKRDLTVTVDGVTVSNYTLQDNNYVIAFTTAPSDGSQIVASYVTSDSQSVAYTLYRRIPGYTSGGLSFVHGYGAATSFASVAVGYDTRATKAFALAEGFVTVASGMASHAGGAHTEANEYASLAHGLYTRANGQAQTVVGRYNVADATSALIIGNGTADNARSNAMTVDWNGNMVLAGSLTADGGMLLPGYTVSFSAVTSSYSADNRLFWNGSSISPGNFASATFAVILSTTPAVNRSALYIITTGSSSIAASLIGTSSAGNLNISFTNQNQIAYVTTGSTTASIVRATIIKIR